MPRQREEHLRRCPGGQQYLDRGHAPVGLQRRPGGELNESCWLGVQKVNPAYSGLVYQQAIKQYVNALNTAGMYVIVDMHFSSKGGKAKATAPGSHARRPVCPGLLVVCGRRLQEQPGGDLRLVQRALSEPQHRFLLFLGL